MKYLGLVSSAVVLAASLAVADPFPTTMAADGYDATPDAITTPNANNDGPPDLYTEVNRFAGTSYTDNSGIDSRWIQPNDLFNTIGGSSTVSMVGLTAGYSNTLGWYPAGNSASQTALISDESGFGETTGPTASFARSGAFGFYLKSVTNDAIPVTNYFYSEPSLNSDQIDHLVTYRISELDGQAFDGHTYTNAYLMGWEDILRGGDEDYDDMMYLMDVVPTQVPEPASLGLLGIGLLGVVAASRRRKN